MKMVKNVTLALGLLLAAVYFLRRRVFALFLGLTPPMFKLRIERGLRIPMYDGLTLAADCYHPITAEPLPTILIRSPYGRTPQHGIFGFMIAFFARRFAERGYHVMVQDIRGRFDSEGVFDPGLNEKDDGHATLDWLSRQTWYNGVVGMWGSSYLGIVQWMVAPDSPQIKALVPCATGSRLYNILFPDGAFDLGLAMRWLALFQILDQHRGEPIWAMRPKLREIRGAAALRAKPLDKALVAVPLLQQVEQQITPAFEHLPVTDDDVVALKAPTDYYRRWLENPLPNTPLWSDPRANIRVEDVTAPTHLVGGWYDFFLRALLSDYIRLQAAGRRPYLTIGPWHHFHPILLFGAVRVGLEWFDTHLKGSTNRLRRKPVRIFVMGANQWRELDAWPPPSTTIRHYLHPLGELRPEKPPVSAETDHYEYNPAYPTPALGGTQFSPAAGARDNRPLEGRSDVLVYTSEPLRQPMEVIGAVSLELYVCSSAPSTDFFGRLCDVHPDGRSINICDGLFRITPGQDGVQPDGTRRIVVDMWSTAHRFKPGHRIRLQVSSGAHPRWSRNLGTDNPITGGECVIARQTVYHDAEHPSALVLPVVSP